MKHCNLAERIKCSLDVTGLIAEICGEKNNTNIIFRIVNTFYRNLQAL